MRRTLLATAPLLLLLAALAITQAAPAPPAGPGDGANPVTPQLRNDAQYTANTLFNVAQNVNNASLPPIEPGDLLMPAVRRWYEEVREPLPPGFVADFKAAGNDGGKLTNLVIQHRERLGEQPALVQPRGLFIALQAMGKSIDPYSGPAPLNRAFVGRGDDNTTGGGFDLAQELDLSPLLAVNNAPVPTTRVPPPPWRVHLVTPGGPAQKAGLRPGDVIVKIEGKKPDEEGAAALMRAVLPPPLTRDGFDPVEQPGANPADFKVTLTIRRDGRNDPLDIKLVGGSYVAETVFGVRRQTDATWDYWADREQKIGYIRIGAIGRQTPEQLHTALDRLRGEARGLIIDLRWCPGGYLNEAIQLVRPFLKEGVIATSVSRNQGDPARGAEIENRYEVDFHDAELAALPLIVLTGPETTGGGELLSASLQDNGRAKIAGLRTRGKGSIQTELTSAVPGMSFKVTSGRFVRPSKKNLDRVVAGTSDEWGVKPDKGYDLPVTPELAKQIKQDWLLHALRPANSREVLPLDEPGHDPQFAGAVRLMLRDLKQAAKK